MPTAAERAGDFSSSTDANGKLLVIKDPLNNNLPFPGNKIDPARISSSGLAILNFFPLPNYVSTDPLHLYDQNYRNTATPTHPRRNDHIRFDANLESNLTVFVRYGHDYDFQDLLAGTSYMGTQSNFQVADGQGQRSNWFQGLDYSGRNTAIGLTYTISPATVNELNVGISHTQWLWTWKDPTQISRDRMGNPPHWYDTASLQKQASSAPAFFQEYIPRVSFAGGQLPSTAPAEGQAGTADQEPRTAYGDTFTINDSVSHVRGSHSFKFGVYIERTLKHQGIGAFYNGDYNFGASTTGDSLNDTGNGFANALLGNVQSSRKAPGRSIMSPILKSRHTRRTVG
ncbi:MAG: hypothetical protein NTW28_18635, partial [Candidatus Solibacter sp.]|nr:hypothetical protein [Candidatus Solibacter sp.]